MTRLWSTLQWDVRSQWRQGLYYAAAFVVVIWAALFTYLPPQGVVWLLPFAIFMDLSVFGVYFMAGILYLEKGDGVLEALVVTPLRNGEYLAAKLVSLTLLAMLATILVVLIGHGAQVQWHWLLLGVGFNSWFMILVGFILAARYTHISEFLIPSILFMAPSQLPLLDYFGVWEGWPIYLVPTQATMILIEAAFAPVATWELIYALVYLAAASAAVTWLGMRTFEAFVVTKTRRQH